MDRSEGRGTAGHDRCSAVEERDRLLRPDSEDHELHSRAKWGSSSRLLKNDFPRPLEQFRFA